MPIVTPSDVAQLQTDIRSEADGLSQALKACMYANTVSASDPIVSQWISMRQRVDSFLAQDPSWLHTAAQMDAGQQIQRDLQPWHQRMIAKGCADVPAAPQPPPAPGDIFGSITNIGLILIVLLAMRELR